MRIVSMNCPNCGATLQVDADNKQITCSYCGNALFVDDEANHMKIDNPERVGYEFEKGRQRAQAEQRYTQPNMSSQTTNYSQPKKRRTWLWVLGWLFLFPVPLTIIVVRNKKMSKGIKAAIIAAAWVLFLIIGIAGAGSDTEDTGTPDDKSISGVTASYNNDIRSLSFSSDEDVTVKVGQKATGYIRVDKKYGVDLSSDSVLFISEDPEIATIKIAKDPVYSMVYYEISGISSGETSVYASTQDGSVQSERIKVIVPKQIEVESITIETEISVLSLGESKSLTASILPENADNKIIHWESSNDSVLTVDEKGNILAVGGGTATITAKASNGVSASQEWNVDGSKRKMSLRVSHIRQDDNNIGDEWSFVSEINGEPTSRDYSVAVGDSLKCWIKITESDDNPDVGQASKTHTVSEGDLENGFTVEMDVYVTENGGRNSGKSAHYVVTFDFTLD